MQKVNIEFGIQAVDEARRVVTGVVYSPNKLDSFGSFMDAEAVERLCHRFMALGLNESIDTDHDNILNGCYAVESYIARGNPDYLEGSWVMSVKVTNEAVWKRIKNNEINAYSMEIMLLREPMEIEVTTDTNQFGEVEPNEDGHTHYYFAKLDPLTGKVIGGTTSITNGHYHDITVNSVTNIKDNHKHRFILG